MTLKLREEKSISFVDVNEMSLQFSVFRTVLHLYWLTLTFLKDDLIYICKPFFFFKLRHISKEHGCSFADTIQSTLPSPVIKITILTRRKWDTF